MSFNQIVIIANSPEWDSVKITLNGILVSRQESRLVVLQSSRLEQAVPHSDSRRLLGSSRYELPILRGVGS